MKSGPLRQRGYCFDGFLAADAPRQLDYENRPVHITPQQFKLLWLLLENRGETVRRETIREALWGDGTYVDFERNINVTVQQLRQRLASRVPNAQFIETVPREGYRFVRPVELTVEERGVRSGRWHRCGVNAAMALILGGIVSFAALRTSPIQSKSRRAAQAVSSPEISTLRQVALAQRKALSNDRAVSQYGLAELRELHRRGVGQGGAALARVSFQRRWTGGSMSTTLEKVSRLAETASPNWLPEAELLRYQAYKSFRGDLDSQRAREAVTRSLRADPGDWRSWELLALVELSLARFQEAEEIFSHLSGWIGRPGGAADRAYAWLIRGEPAEALAVLDSVAGQPITPFGRLVRIYALDSLNRPEERSAEVGHLTGQSAAGEPKRTRTEDFFRLARYLTKSTQSGIQAETEVALAYWMARDMGQARAWLLQACRARSGWTLPYIDSDPRLLGLAAEVGVDNCRGIRG